MADEIQSPLEKRGDGQLTGVKEPAPEPVDQGFAPSGQPSAKRPPA